MRRATPLGHERKTPAPDQNEHGKLTPAATPAPDNNSQSPHCLSVVRDAAPAAERRRPSGEHRRRMTPARATIQPSNPERLRKALEAMREMNKLTRRRTEEMRALSVLSRDLARQMQTLGSVIGGLKIPRERRSGGG